MNDVLIIAVTGANSAKSFDEGGIGSGIIPKNQTNAALLRLQAAGPVCARQAVSAEPTSSVAPCYKVGVQVYAVGLKVPISNAQ